MCHQSIHWQKTIREELTMAGPEAKLESALEDWCDSKGWLCLKLVNTARRGFPDRTVIGPGWVAFIELKAPGGRLSHHQRETIGWLRDKNCQVLVSDDLAEAQTWLTHIHERKTA